MLGADQVIKLNIMGTTESLLLPRVEQIVLGRSTPPDSKKLHIDLTPYGALPHGVSRTHALISISDDRVTITDLNSRNGTYLNGQPLSSHEPRILRSGDEIRLGNLVVYAYFARQRLL